MSDIEDMQEGQQFAADIHREPPNERASMIRDALDIKGHSRAFRIGFAHELKARRIIGIDRATQIKEGGKHND